MTDIKKPKHQIANASSKEKRVVAMHFHFKNLGLLDEVDLELGKLTLICGENNSGKTYVTYAVYGFLREWKNIFREFIQDKIPNITGKNQYQIDLQTLFSNDADAYLEEIGDMYAKLLHRVFASKKEVFEKTIFKPKFTQPINFNKPYHLTITAGDGKSLATLSKDKNSSILSIEILTTDQIPQKRIFSGVRYIIADSIAEIVLSDHLPRVHISSAERTGAAIFRKELDIARARMLKALHETDSEAIKKNPFSLLQKMDSGYAWPVEENIEFARKLEDLEKQTGPLAEHNPELLDDFDEIIGGRYRVVKDNLVFENQKKQRFTMNEASSCVRALLDIGFYLRSEAQPGDLLIIDEPELNLHPKNQRAFARLIARLINADLRLLITTHSDYLIKEINTLIMLNQGTQHTKNIQKHYDYKDTELLDPKSIRLYMTSTVKEKTKSRGPRSTLKKLKRANIEPERGIEVETFDTTIEIMNKIQNDIMFGDEN